MLLHTFQIQLYHFSNGFQLNQQTVNLPNNELTNIVKKCNATVQCISSGSKLQT